MALLIARKSGRVEHNDIEAPPLTGKAVEPVQGIALAEVVVIGVDIIQRHILPAPAQAGLSQVECGGLGSSQGRTNRKGTRIGKGVQYLHAGAADTAQLGTVITLVQENSLRVPCPHVHEIAHTILLNHKTQRHLRPAEKHRRLLHILIQAFHIHRAPRGAQFILERRGQFYITQ